LIVNHSNHWHIKPTAININPTRNATSSDPAYIHTYPFTDPSSAQVGLNAEFVMKRAKLQYAVKSNKLQIT